MITFARMLPTALCASVLFFAVHGSATAEGVWSQITGAGPPASAGHASCYDANGKHMIVFGGEDIYGNLSSDVWILTLDCDTPYWRMLTPPAQTPPPRKEATLVYDPGNNRVILFGGEGADESLLGDAWSLTLADSTWARITASGSPPCPRSGHVAVYGDGVMYVHAGAIQNPSGPGHYYTYDTFTLSLGASPSWSRYAPAYPCYDASDCALVNPDQCGNDWPEANWYEAAVWDPLRSRMVVHGGSYQGDPATSATWQLFSSQSSATHACGSPTRWCQIFQNYGPPQLENHRAAFDSHADRMLVFGGDHGTGAPEDTVADVWQLGLQNEVPSAWTQVSTSGQGPGRRSFPAVIYDPAGNRLVVFGGEDGNHLYGDTWQLQFDAAPPATTTDLNVSSISGGVTFQWTAPGNDGTGGGNAVCYTVRKRAGEPITEANWLSSTLVTGASGPSAPGTMDNITIGLSSGVYWYVALKTSDAAGNFSGLSNVACIKLGNPPEYCDTPDTQPPATTTDLNVVSITGGVKFKWTAPGDDGTGGGNAASYTVRKRSGTPITEANWLSSTIVTGASGPSTPGTKDSVKTGLSSGVYWYVALKTTDAIGNTSGVSNNACIKLGNPPDYCDGGLFIAEAPDAGEPAVEPAVELAISALRPNPSARGRTDVVFSLFDASPAILRIYDIAGRLVESHDLAPGGSRTQEMSIGVGRKLSPGFYRVRISQGGRSVTRSLIVAR